jgi:hypothetical protein
VAVYFAERGFAAASTGYRLSSDYRYPAQIEDIRLAMQRVFPPAWRCCLVSVMGLATVQVRKIRASQSAPSKLFLKSLSRDRAHTRFVIRKRVSRSRFSWLWDTLFAANNICCNTNPNPQSHIVHNVLRFVYFHIEGPYVQ